MTRAVALVAIGGEILVLRAERANARQAGPCSAEGCSRNAYARWYCVMHYNRRRRHGDVTVVLRHGRLHGPHYEQACQLRRDNPAMTLDAIGKQVGVSRERIRQLLKKAGLETHSTGNHRRAWRPCAMECGRLTLRTYCSRKCSAAAYHLRMSTVLTCTQCGKEFLRQNALIRTRAKNYLGKYTTTNVFCNKVCQGRYVGAHFGIGTPGHPAPQRKKEGNHASTN